MHTLGHQYILFYFFVSNYGKQETFVNKTETSMDLQKAFFSRRTIKDCRFEILDGVKHDYCLKHSYNISSGGTSRVCGNCLTLESMCFLLTCEVYYEICL